MLISIHIPKTAGSSFKREIAEAKLGNPYFDYEDNILSYYPRHVARRLARRLYARCFWRNVEAKYEIIHGHFMANKYRGLFSEERFIAFFRDPIDRVVSHYYFWKNGLSHLHVKHSFYSQTVGAGMDLVEFSETDWMREFYRRILGGVPLKHFYFIGLTEEYSRSLALLSALTGATLAACVDNSNAQRPRLDNIPKSQLDALRKANCDNLEIYREATSVFHERCRSVLRGRGPNRKALQPRATKV